MNLYLSSYKLGNKKDILIDWNKNHKKVLIIPNASDIYPDNDIKLKDINECINELIEIGYICEILNLKNWFNKEKKLNNFLKNYDSFYVLGGNTFTLRQAMKLSGFDKYLKNNIHNPNIMYIGYSAGICVLASDLHGIEYADSIEKDPYNYGSIEWEGVGIIDFMPIPHYNSENNILSLKMNAVEKSLKDKGERYITLSDGEAIYLKNN